MADGTLLVWEVHLFVTKFMNLFFSVGHNACLSLDYKDGKLEVNLNTIMDEAHNSFQLLLTSLRRHVYVAEGALRKQKQSCFK